MIDKSKKDIGKNVYKAVTYVTLKLEQIIKADNEEQANDIFWDRGGMSYNSIDNIITRESDDVCTDNISLVRGESPRITYKGKIVSDPDSDFDEDVIIDYFAKEIDLKESA